MNVITSELITEQFRFPRTKKRRIRNKWSARPENWRASRRGYMMDDTFYIHPKMVALLRAQQDTPPDIGCAINRELFNLI